MTLDDIKAMIAYSESRFIEYKQSMAELEKLGKAICGFFKMRLIEWSVLMKLPSLLSQSVRPL